MKKIIYQEFGVRIEVLKYRVIGEELKGMREGKPFISGNDIKINVEGNLYLVEKIKFSDSKGNLLKRSDVQLDTEHRVAGVILNSKKQILLLEVARDKNFYCFPGGHQREGEGTEECLKREMEEETGIDISRAKISPLLKMHAEKFGPETFFLIEFNDAVLDYKDDNSEDEKSTLVFHDMRNIWEYKNLYPVEVLNKLRVLFNNGK